MSAVYRGEKKKIVKANKLYMFLERITVRPQET